MPATVPSGGSATSPGSVRSRSTTSRATVRSVSARWSDEEAIHGHDDPDPEDEDDPADHEDVGDDQAAANAIEHGAPSGPQDVADAADRVDEGRVEAVVDLAPEVVDVEVDDVGARLGVVAPDVLQDPVPRQDLPDVAARSSSSANSWAESSSRRPPRLAARASGRARGRPRGAGRRPRPSDGDGPAGGRGAPRRQTASRRSRRRRPPGRQPDPARRRAR